MLIIDLCHIAKSVPTGGSFPWWCHRLYKLADFRKTVKGRSTQGTVWARRDFARQLEDQRKAPSVASARGAGGTSPRVALRWKSLQARGAMRSSLTQSTQVEAVQRLADLEALIKEGGGEGRIERVCRPGRVPNRAGSGAQGRGAPLRVSDWN